MSLMSLVFDSIVVVLTVGKSMQSRRAYHTPGGFLDTILRDGTPFLLPDMPLLSIHSHNPTTRGCIRLHILHVRDWLPLRAFSYCLRVHNIISALASTQLINVLCYWVCL